MRTEAQKKITAMFCEVNRINIDVVPANWRQVISHAIAPGYLFIESLDSPIVLESENPVDGILINQFHRVFDVLSGMLALSALGQAQAAEVLSRTTMESALTLTYIVKENTNVRVMQYFSKYIKQEREQNRKWRKAAESLPEQVGKEHKNRVTQKDDSLRSYEESLKQFASHLGMEFPPAKGFPNFITVCESLEKSIDYRTVYMAMCSQTHHDAEDSLNRLLAGISDNADNLEKTLRLETNNFSYFLIIYAVRYYIECVRTLGERYHFSSVLKQSEKSYTALSKLLVKVSSGGFVKNSAHGWVQA